MGAACTNVIKVMHGWLDRIQTFNKDEVINLVKVVIEKVTHPESHIESSKEIEEIENMLYKILGAAEYYKILPTEVYQQQIATVKDCLRVYAYTAYAEDYAIQGINKYLKYNHGSYSQLDEDRAITYANMLQPYEIGCTVHLCYNILRTLSHTNSIHRFLIALGGTYYDYMLRNHIYRSHVITYLNVITILGYAHPNESYFEIVKRAVEAYQDFYRGNSVPLTDDNIKNFLDSVGLGVTGDSDDRY